MRLSDLKQYSLRTSFSEEPPGRRRDYSPLIPSQSRVLCRGEQLLLTFSDEGSRQLKLFWASLTLQGPEWIDPTFSRSRIKRRDQREKVAISNRLPRFRIRVHFAPIPLLDSRKP